jgi:hypothetical protein
MRAADGAYRDLGRHIRREWAVLAGEEEIA